MSNIGATASSYGSNNADIAVILWDQTNKLITGWWSHNNKTLTIYYPNVQGYEHASITAANKESLGINSFGDLNPRNGCYIGGAVFDTFDDVDEELKGCTHYIISSASCVNEVSPNNGKQYKDLNTSTFVYVWDEQHGCYKVYYQ